MGVLACCCCCWCGSLWWAFGVRDWPGRPFFTICGVRLSDAVAEDVDAPPLAAVDVVAPPPVAMPDVLGAELLLTLVVVVVALAFSCFSTASVMDDSCGGAEKERWAPCGSLLLSLLALAPSSSRSISIDQSTCTSTRWWRCLWWWL